MTNTSTAEQLRLGIVVASTRPERFADTISAWLMDSVSQHNAWEPDLIDLRDIDLESDTASFEKRIESSDAYIFLVPEYNHSYPAPLKAALDALWRQWNAKPAGFVSYGGISGGLRAVEQLRLVLAELHVVGIRDGVSFHNARSQFNSNGQPIHAERVGKAAFKMLDNLKWWAEALRDAKRRSPYAA